jgi:FkbM family methyltransferase
MLLASGTSFLEDPCKSNPSSTGRTNTHCDESLRIGLRPKDKPAGREAGARDTLSEGASTLGHPILALRSTMRIVSSLLPQKTRHRLRRSLDSLYSKDLPGKVTLGVRSQWTVSTRGLHTESIIYSGGVGEDITFEQELIHRFGVKIHIFDPSPVAQVTIAAANNDRLLFKPIGLSASSDAKFSIGGGENSSIWLKAGGSETLPCTSIAQEMSANGHHSIDLLKIDIEGFEYEVLESCLAAQIPIKQICVEFHDFFPDIPKIKTKNMILALQSHGFELIHRHRHDHTFLRSST